MSPCRTGLASVDDGITEWGWPVLVTTTTTGFPDIYGVTTSGKNILYHNQWPTATFTDVTAKAGVAAGGMVGLPPAPLFDYDNDGRLGSVRHSLIDWTVANSKTCATKMAHVHAPPTEFPLSRTSLYHNRGDGTFEDVSVPSGIAARKGHSRELLSPITMAGRFPRTFFLWPQRPVHQSISLFITTANGTFQPNALSIPARPFDQRRQMLSGMGRGISGFYDNDAFPTFSSRNSLTSLNVSLP